MAIDPGVADGAEQWKADVPRTPTPYGRAAGPGGPPVRMPFDRSREERRRRLAEDAIDVADTVYEALRRVAGRTA